jgi:hypothetical protein
MFNIFDQPWTLLATAVLFLFGILTFRSVIPEKRRWWQWLIPILIVFIAFEIDFLVQTDTEKVITIINQGIQAVEEENCDAIEALIDENYSDSYHNTKEHLISHCRQELSQNIVEKNKKTNSPRPTISGNNATATVFMTTTFNKDSYVTQNYNIPFILIEADLYLKKQPDNNWLLNRIEVRRLNRQQTNWSQIR